MGEEKGKKCRLKYWSGDKKGDTPISRPPTYGKQTPTLIERPSRALEIEHKGLAASTDICPRINFCEWNLPNQEEG